MSVKPTLKRKKNPEESPEVSRQHKTKPSQRIKLIPILNTQKIIEHKTKKPSQRMNELLDEAIVIINHLNDTHETDILLYYIKTLIIEYNTLKKTANECEIDKVGDEDEDDIKHEDIKCDRQLSDKIAEIHEYLHLILDVLITEFPSITKFSPIIKINIKNCISLIERNLSAYQDYIVSKKPMTLKGYTTNTVLVNGPVSFYIFVSPDQKKYIYLFGDVHTKESGCDKSKQFIRLENLIRNTIRIHSDKIIDVFLETPIFRDTFNNSFMSELVRSFILDKCTLPYTFYPDTCKKTYPNARFHSTNIRWSYIKRPELSKMLKSSTPDMEILDFISETVTRQILAVEDELIQAKLLEIPATIHTDKSDKLSPLMDVYLLGRLFRSYRSCGFKEDIKDKKVDFDNEDVNYAIVYTGNAHTDSYCDFLLSIDYALLYEVNKTKPYTQCIEIPVLVDTETGAPFLGFGHDLKTPSKMRVKRRGSARARRVKKSKSISKKPMRGSTHARRVKKSKSITKSKRGSARARRVKKSKSISKKPKRDRLD